MDHELRVQQYPEPFHAHFGIGPDVLAITVRAHLYLGDQAYAYADAIVLEAHYAAYETVLANMEKQKKADTAAASAPKFGMTRGQRKAFFKANPTLASAPLGLNVDKIIKEHEAEVEGLRPILPDETGFSDEIPAEAMEDIENRVSAYIIDNPEEFPDAPTSSDSPTG